MDIRGLDLSDIGHGDIQFFGKFLLRISLQRMLVIAAVSLAELAGMPERAGKPEKTDFEGTVTEIPAGYMEYERFQGEKTAQEGRFAGYRIRRRPAEYSVCRVCRRKGKTYIPGFFCAGPGKKAVYRFVIKRRHI